MISWDTMPCLYINDLLHVCCYPWKNWLQYIYNSNVLSHWRFINMKREKVYTDENILKKTVLDVIKKKQLCYFIDFFWRILFDTGTLTWLSGDVHTKAHRYRWSPKYSWRTFLSSSFLSLLLKVGKMLFTLNNTLLLIVKIIYRLAHHDARENVLYERTRFMQN